MKDKFEMSSEAKAKMAEKEDIKEEKQQEKNLTEEIAKLEKEAADLRDKYTRKLAEFDNFKKRKETEVENYFKYANEDLIRDLLSVIDDMERSLNYVKDENNHKNLIEGFELIYNKFIKTLSGYGLSKIDAINKPFDVHFHEALMQVERPELPPHTVVDVAQNGYMLKDKVLRHTRVIVNSDNITTEEKK